MKMKISLKCFFLSLKEEKIIIVIERFVKIYFICVGKNVMLDEKSRKTVECVNSTGLNMFSLQSHTHNSIFYEAGYFMNYPLPLH